MSVCIHLSIYKYVCMYICIYLLIYDLNAELPELVNSPFWNDEVIFVYICMTIYAFMIIHMNVHIYVQT
jgi:hypothetical protein